MSPFSGFVCCRKVLLEHLSFYVLHNTVPLLTSKKPCSPVHITAFFLVFKGVSKISCLYGLPVHGNKDILNLPGNIYYIVPSYHNLLTFSFVQQSHIWCTIWDQRVEESLGGSSDSCFRVVWRAERWEHCKLGDVGCIGMLFWGCNL